MDNVCIIDDDKIHHFTIEKTIQLQGLSKNLRSFHDGHDAIAFFNQNLDNVNVLPDVIFLDLNMPIVNGWQFLKHYALLKSQIQKQIKIYIVSSSINESEITKATSIEEVSGYLEKPLRPEEIRKVFLNNN
ncbi:MAG: response regulator [Sphingobacteriaceae bacterium]|nr:response regulator [Sphingobacteriaceae bacterium]